MREKERSARQEDVRQREAKRSARQEDVRQKNLHQEGVCQEDVRREKTTRHKEGVRRRCTLIVAVFSALLLLSFAVSMSTGYTGLSPLDIARILTGSGTPQEELILFEFRLPRIVISVFVGMGLALAGCIIQSVTRNALADPGLLGINAGAGIMVILFSLFIGRMSFYSVFLLPVLALCGASLTAVLIYALAYRKSDGVAPLRLILVGIAVQAGIAAVTMLLVVKFDDTQLADFATWQAGSIWGSNWQYVLALLPWLALLVPFVLTKSRVLDVLLLGNETAISLGIPLGREQVKLLAAAVALAASSVAVSGSIGFVGLIAPHLARRLVGSRHHILLPVCALTGAVLVSVADTIARSIVQPAEIPAGIIVAVIGAPYFLYLLAKSKF
jgi:iron complex transport system permease protein